MKHSANQVRKKLFNNYSPKEVNIVELSPGDYSTIFTEPEENNCFSIIAQVVIRETASSFILLVFSLKTARNRAAAILKISASVLYIITSREVIKRPIRARASL